MTLTVYVYDVGFEHYTLVLIEYANEAVLRVTEDSQPCFCYLKNQTEDFTVVQSNKYFYYKGK